MTKFVLGLVGTGMFLLAGCVNVNVPEDVVHVSSTPRVDSSRVPKTRNMSECQAELNRAYAYIQALERKNQRLESDKSEMKTKVKQLEKRLERYED